MERSSGDGYYRMWRSSFAGGVTAGKDLLIHLSFLAFPSIYRVDFEESTGGSKILYCLGFVSRPIIQIKRLSGGGTKVQYSFTPWPNGNPIPFFSVQLRQIKPPVWNELPVL